MSELQVKVSSSKKAGKQCWSGTVTIPGLRPTKLARRSDGSTTFSSRTSVTSCAQSVAKTLGFKGIKDSSEKTTQKKAAKAKATNTRTKKTASSATSRRSTKKKTPKKKRARRSN